jgi:hypothetical protein
VELLQLLVGAYDHRQLILDGAELRAGNSEVGLRVVGASVDAVPDATETAAVRSELIASGNTAQVGRPRVAPVPATPAACAASARSINCCALPRTSTASAGTGVSASGASTGAATT